ncbi:Shal [Symbiodinium microadriaticum]|nr:Shal [Symbiodinium microadriaticum]
MQGSEESSSSDADSVENFDRSSKPLRQPAVARLPSHSSDSDSSAEVQRAIDEDVSESSSDSISQANSRARTAQSPPVSKASSPARTAQSPSSPHVEAEKPRDRDKETDGPAPTPPEQVLIDVPTVPTQSVDVTPGQTQREEIAGASDEPNESRPQVAGARDAVPDVAEELQRPTAEDVARRQREQRLQTRRLEAALWNSLCMEDKDKLQNMLQVIEDSKSQLRRSGAEEVDLQSILDSKEPLLPKPRKHSMRARVYDILEGKGPYGSTYSFLLTIVILVNIASFMLSTEPSMAEHQPLFDRIEMVTVCIFTFEYVLRFSTRAGSCLARITWVFTNFFSIVDLVSIMPFYADILIPGRQNYLATQWVRVVRLLRLLPSLPYDVIWKKSYKLLMASGFAGCTVWVICAALYYWFEKDNADMIYCPDEDGKKEGLCWNRFHSIPAAMYYSLLNFFGEFPLADKHSLGGRFVGGFIQVMGAAVMAIPAGALGNAFSEVVEKELSAKEQDLAGGVDDESVAAQVVRCLDGEREAVRTYRVADVTVDMADLWFSLLAASFSWWTVHNLPVKLDELFFLLYAFDILSTLVFCVEYFFRICSARAPARYLLSGFGVVDGLSAVLPAVSYVYPRPVFRAFTTLRVLKLERYIGAFGTFKNILYQSRSVLFVTGGAAAVLWVIFSTLMYYAERYNPDPDMAGTLQQHSGAFGTVALSWSKVRWVTLLNLSGEAPLCEYTPVGKFISALMGLIGVGFVTIPMGLLGSGFQDYLEQEDDDDPVAKPSGQLVHKFLQGSASNQVEDLNAWEARAVYFERCIFLAIFVTVLAAIMETVDGFAPSGSLNRDALNFIEITATLLFTIEYGLRYYTAPEVPYWAEQGYVSDNAARFGFVTSLPALIDLTAIAPYYLALCGSSVADRYDGELRMLRIFRLLTLDKYIPSVSLIGRVFRKHSKEFQLAAYAAAAIWLIFSALMWLTERHDPTQVDDLTMGQRYGSMPEAMPYTLVHLTGDYPLIDYDFPAKCVLFVALLFAVGVVAVPTGLLASGFAQELTKYREEQRRLREEAATKIEKALRQYIRRRRLRQVATRVQAQKTVLRELKDKAFKDNPYKLRMVKFLEQKTTAGRLCKKAMFLLIILNVLAVIAESMSWVKEAAGSYVLNGFELFSVLVFTFEYSANVWSAPANSRYMFCRRNYVCSFFGIVDLVTVAPFWIQTVMWLSGLQFNAFVFRIARLLRILQLEDFVESFTLLDDAWRSCRETMVATGFMALLVWICGAVLFYEFEQDNPAMDGAFKDPACQDLRRRLEKAEQEARLARERELRSIDQITRWDSKRLHCEEASEGVELLRLSLDNVKAELKRLEHEAEPGRSWLHSLRERQMASQENARLSASRLTTLKAQYPQRVAEMKASQVQEIADLRSSQAEELLKLEVDWTTQDDFFDLLPIEYPFQAPEVGIDPVAGRLLRACGSLQNLTALAIAASQLHSFNVKPDGSYDLTLPQFDLELNSAEVSELLGTCRQLFDSYAQLAALDFEVQLRCSGESLNCAAHSMAVLRKPSDLCQTACHDHHYGDYAMNLLTISDVAERSAARMCSVVVGFCQSLQESQAGVTGFAGFARQAAAEIRIFLDHAFHVLSFLPIGLRALQPFSDLLEHGSPAFRHVPVAGLRWDVLLHILGSFGAAERSRGLRVAEIGVEKGMTVTFLMKHEPAIVDYYLVDPWHVPGKSQESNGVLQSYYENLEAWSSEEPAFQRNGRKAAHVLRQSSEEAAGQLGTDYFDLVFIDAEHTFEAVRRDIQVWKRRVRPGGILAGHDFSLFHPAVSLAVLVECGPLSDDTGRFPLQSELEKPIIHLSADSVWWVRRA